MLATKKDLLVIAGALFPCLAQNAGEILRLFK
jgi:hypothetical protein